MPTSCGHTDASMCVPFLRFADDVHRPKNSFKKCCANSRRVLKIRIHPVKTKILCNRGSDTRKGIEVDNIKVEILSRGESTKYLGQMITFQQQETTEIRNRIRAAWATFHKYRQELTSKNYLLKHRLRAIRRSVHSDDVLRIRNMDTHKRARKNDTIDATQNAPTLHTNEDAKRS